MNMVAAAIRNCMVKVILSMGFINDYTMKAYRGMEV
jgi:hypothetical protein